MHLELWQIVLLCIAAFAAGFIDAIVGGGGLVQLIFPWLIKSVQAHRLLQTRFFWFNVPETGKTELRF